jgi:putative ABC transport system permease protein
MHFYLKNISLILDILRRNKVRSFLTSLGIVIGISAVIIIMSVGAGARSLLINEIQSQGTNLLSVLPGGSGKNEPPAALFGINITTLVYDDAQAIAKQVSGAEAVCAYVRGVATASWQDKIVDTSLLGVTDSYTIVEGTAEVSRGRFISQEEAGQVARVVVLGSQVADDLFTGSDPLGQRIKINKESFMVVGVMKEVGSNGIQNQDNQVLIPLQTAQKLMLGINYLSFIRVKLGPQVDYLVAEEEVRAVLRQQHNIINPEDDDFSVRSQEEALNTLKSVTDILNYFLALVAGISLLVGGIGIMNIMLVSVSESTKEIGLRKAVGATKRDINLYFLLQTIILTLLGGLLGVLGGIFISFLISLVAKSLGYQWDFIISLSSIILALVFTILVALVFGWYPAKRAADLNPLEALRYE